MGCVGYLLIFGRHSVADVICKFHNMQMKRFVACTLKAKPKKSYNNKHGKIGNTHTHGRTHTQAHRHTPMVLHITQQADGERKWLREATSGQLSAADTSTSSYKQLMYLTDACARRKWRSCVLSVIIKCEALGTRQKGRLCKCQPIERYRYKYSQLKIQIHWLQLFFFGWCKRPKCIFLFLSIFFCS